MSMLNDYVDKIYCINLETAKDRLKGFENAADFEFEVFKAFGKYETIDYLKALYGNQQSKYKFKQSAWYAKNGCKLSHLHILKDAYKQNLKRIIIFEDDVKITDQLNSNLETYFKELPADWNYLYLGYYIKDKYRSRLQNTSYKVSDNLYTITSTHGAHAIVYNLESPQTKLVFETMLNNYIPNGHYDLELNDVCNDLNISRHVPYPQHIAQHNGFSFINNRDKSWDLQPTDPRFDLLKSGTVYTEQYEFYKLIKDELIEGSSYIILQDGYEVNCKLKNNVLVDESNKPLTKIPIYIRLNAQ